MIVVKDDLCPFNLCNVFAVDLYTVLLVNFEVCNTISLFTFSEDNYGINSTHTHMLCHRHHRHHHQ